MTINFDVVIETGQEYSVDMKSGLDTLQGISDSTRYIAETLLTEHVPQKLTHTRKIRTDLKKSFKGSFGQQFSLVIEDRVCRARFNRMGRGVFAELVSYFISESLYMESQPLSEKAQAKLESLGEKEDVLLEQLRKSSLHLVHEVSTKFGHNVKLRYRKNREEQTIIAQFDRSTVLTLEPLAENGEQLITASITRLNINTGNGRLLPANEDDTVSFGFGGLYREVRIELRKRFSENLNYNNQQIDRTNWRQLQLKVKPMKLRSGKIVKYIIKGIIDE